MHHVPTAAATMAAAVHHMPTTATAVTAATMAAGFRFGGGEGRHADNDCRGEGEDCSALEHV
jgi:hypothetical protein